MRNETQPFDEYALKNRNSTVKKTRVYFLIIKSLSPNFTDEVETKKNEWWWTWTEIREGENKITVCVEHNKKKKRLNTHKIVGTTQEKNYRKSRALSETVLSLNTKESKKSKEPKNKNRKKMISQCLENVCKTKCNDHEKKSNKE